MALRMASNSVLSFIDSFLCCTFYVSLSLSLSLSHLPRWWCYYDYDYIDVAGYWFRAECSFLPAFGMPCSGRPSRRWCRLSNLRYSHTTESLMKKSEIRTLLNRSLASFWRRDRFDCVSLSGRFRQLKSTRFQPLPWLPMLLIDAGWFVLWIELQSSWGLARISKESLRIWANVQQEQ